MCVCMQPVFLFCAHLHAFTDTYIGYQIYDYI